VKKIALVLAVSAAALLTTAGPAQATHSNRCTPKIYFYDYGSHVRALFLMRCTAGVRGISIYGYFSGAGYYYEVAKNCSNTKYCSEWTPLFRDPAGRQKWIGAATMAYKNHWYSITKYYWGGDTWYA
jgi:hypothetical protein